MEGDDLRFGVEGEAVVVFDDEDGFVLLEFSGLKADELTCFLGFDFEDAALEKLNLNYGLIMP